MNNLDICVSFYGEAKIKLLYALLASIMRTYGAGGGVTITLMVQGVSDAILDEIRRKVTLKLNILKHNDPIGRDKISGKMELWGKLVDVAKGPNVLLIDADTVLVRDIRHFFGKSFDVGFTYKTDTDENLMWPINTGVILLKKNSKSILFFREWVSRTMAFIKDHKNETKRLEGWGALDQAAFGDLLGVRTPDKFGKGVVVGGCFVQGFPCSLLNETRCKSTESCYVIHYKGWFQKCVLSGEYNQWRQKDKCEYMKLYWDELNVFWGSL